MAKVAKKTGRKTRTASPAKNIRRSSDAIDKGVRTVRGFQKGMGRALKTLTGKRSKKRKVRSR